MEQRDVQREWMQEDLRGLVAGDVRCDEIFRRIYASDASIYEIEPLGVIRPRTTADVVATVRYAAEKQIPLHARGAGTGLAGESLGRGLTLDFSSSMHRVLDVKPDRIRVQAGVVHERLDALLRSRGRLLGPDPANRAATTVGGMVAVDATGSHWPRYGSTRQHVLGLQIVTAAGQVMEVGREPLVDGRSCDRDPDKAKLINDLTALLTKHRKVIQERRTSAPVDHCGYHLHDVLTGEYLDLAGLIVGSEGTLALVTEATLATLPAPHARGVTLLLFDSLDRAMRAVLAIAEHRPAACDLLDRRYLSLARESEVRFDLLIPPQTEAALVVEHDGDDPRDVRQRLQSLVDQVRHRDQLAFGARQAFDAEEIDLFWHLASGTQPALRRMEGRSRPVSVVEDVAVSPERLPELLVKIQNVLKRHQVTASLSAHALQGQLHVQPFLDLGNPDDVGRMRAVTESLYEEVLQVGGTISGEHGCGLSRTPFVARQCGPLVEVFTQIKELFDPANLLNPGKIVRGRPEQLTEDLRPAIPVEVSGEETSDKDEPAPAMRDMVELQLNWEPSRVAKAAWACNGCGDCRTQDPALRMCPLFRIRPAEEASPRAKANLIRAVLTGQMPLDRLTTDEFKRVVDLCYHCHMCQLECPAHVDIPRLVAEGKGAYVAAKGQGFGEAVMNRIGLLSQLGSLAPPAVNWALANRTVRWLLEKFFGIAQGRKLPRVASRSFIRRAARRRLTKPRRQRDVKVAYFVDTYANYHDPQLGEALLSVLGHNSVAVYVPPQQKTAGTAAIASGALDLARRLAQQNISVLADAVRQGYHILATEPAAVVSLTREYLYWFDDDDARLVAENTSEACSYLWTMHTKGKLQLDLKPLAATVGYHLSCRLKSLGVGAPGENLLRLIPGLSVQRIDAGCSGMAGTFGLQRKNYRTSLRVGWRLISALRDPAIQAGATECSACKIQMEQGTTKPTIHPLKLLALSYGLMPELENLLSTPSGELLVS
ncbi:MAG: FAD-binding protein [Pirellulales bacterium]|nr:FAD-binding protein [Pirellulales bacterium]